MTPIEKRVIALEELMAAVPDHRPEREVLADIERLCQLAGVTQKELADHLAEKCLAGNSPGLGLP